MILKAPALRRGDVVRIIAPASPFERSRFDKGVAELKAMGFEPKWRDDVFSSDGYLAGNDERRAAELTEAFEDREARGVVCARGGYGTPRLLARLDFQRLLKSPKVLVGYSDITALLLAFTNSGLVTFHGPMSTGHMATHGLTVDDRSSLTRTVGEARPAGRIGLGNTIVAGTAEGPLIGGNLALLAAMVGTPWMPSLDGAILFVEDVGEKAFRLDRMLTQLILAGLTKKLAGIALGRFAGCTNPGGKKSAEEVVAEIAASVGVPCVEDLPFGHDGENRTIPLGVRGRISGTKGGQGSLDVLEAAVS